MSLGGSADSTLDYYTQGLIDDGIVTVVAAGNDAGNSCSYSPARVSDAVTVGSTTKIDQDSSFSNIGACVDIFAPGSLIQSAWYSGTSSYNVISGT